MDRRAQRPDHKPSGQPIWWWVALVILYGVALWLGYVYILDMIHIKGNAGRQDWYIFSNQALDYLHAGRLYQDNLALYAPSEPVYKFPPFFDAILVFLYSHGISPETAKQYIVIFNFFLLFFSTWFLLLSIGQGYFACPLLLIFTFISGAFENNLNSLQLEIYIVCLIAVALFLFRRSRYFWGSAMMGLAAGLKIYPIFFCSGIILKNSRAFSGVLFGMAVTLVFSLALVEPMEHYQYFFRILPYLFSENISQIKDNTSLGYLLIVMCGFQEKYTLLISNTILYGTISVVLFNVLSKRKAHDSEKDNVHKFEIIVAEISLLVAVFLLASKNIWLSYQLLMLIPMFGLITFLRGSNNAVWAAVATYCLMCFLMHSWRYYEVGFIKSFIAGIFENTDFIDTIFFFPYFRSFANIVMYLYAAFLYLRVIGVFPGSPVYVQSLRGN